MRSFDFSRCVVGIFAAAALLAGCGGSQPPVAPGALPQSRTTTTRAERGGSWMLPEAKSSDLLYVVGACGGTCVLSYPNGRLVGSLNEPQYGIAAICADKRGNIFIPNHSEILEYAHGGTSPIATLEVPGNPARGCSVDPKTGNLAVVFRTSGADVAIFPGAQGFPSLFASQIDSFYCGYDGSGNLYVNGYNGGYEPGFSVLAYGAKSFQSLSISSSVRNPGQVQFDGTYITYQSASRGYPIISRLQIVGSSANVVGTTTLNGIHRGPYASWIYNGRVVVPYSDHGVPAKKLASWKYPLGGNSVKSFTQLGNQPTYLLGVAVSVAPSR